MKQVDHPRTVYEKTLNKASCSCVEKAFGGEDIVPNKEYVEWLEEKFTSTNKQSVSASQIATQVKNLYNEMPPRDYSRGEVINILQQLHTLS